MAAYIIVSSRITNPEGLAHYRSVVGPTLAGHDVTILVSNDEATVLEGEPPGTRSVVLAFPDRDAALAWYHSAAYQEVIGLRLAATEGHAVLVDGR